MRIILIVFVLFIFSCNHKLERSARLQQLQKIFGTANWQVIKGTDTSYIFFSGRGDNSFKSYQYNLFKGDSSNTEIGSVQLNNDGKVEWSLFNKRLTLYDINGNETKWKDCADTIYVFTKHNDSLLRMHTPKFTLQFKRTLALSTFLVRAKYDYEHGSNWADSAEVKSRKLIQY